MNIHPTLGACHPKYGRCGSNTATSLLPSHHHHQWCHPSPITIQTMSACHAMRTLMTHSNTQCLSSPTTHNHHKNDARVEDDSDEVVPSPGKQAQWPSHPPFWHPTRCDMATRQQMMTSVIVHHILLQGPTTPPCQHATTLWMAMRTNHHQHHPPMAHSPPHLANGMTIHKWTRTWPPMNECDHSRTNMTAHEWMQPPMNECNHPQTNITAHKWMRLLANKNEWNMHWWGADVCGWWLSCVQWLSFRHEGPPSCCVAIMLCCLQS